MVLLQSEGNLYMLIEAVRCIELYLGFSSLCFMVKCIDLEEAPLGNLLFVSDVVGSLGREIVHSVKIKEKYKPQITVINGGKCSPWKRNYGEDLLGLLQAGVLDLLHWESCLG